MVKRGAVRHLAKQKLLKLASPFSLINSKFTLFVSTRDSYKVRLTVIIAINPAGEIRRKEEKHRSVI